MVWNSPRNSQFSAARDCVQIQPVLLSSRNTQTDRRHLARAQTSKHHLQLERAPEIRLYKHERRDRSIGSSIGHGHLTALFCWSAAFEHLHSWDLDLGFTALYGGWVCWRRILAHNFDFINHIVSSASINILCIKNLYYHSSHQLRVPDYVFFYTFSRKNVSAHASSSSLDPTGLLKRLKALNLKVFYYQTLLKALSEREISTGNRRCELKSLDCHSLATSPKFKVVCRWSFESRDIMFAQM